MLRLTSGRTDSLRLPMPITQQHPAHSPVPRAVQHMVTGALGLATGVGMVRGLVDAVESGLISVGAAKVVAIAGVAMTATSVVTITNAACRLNRQAEQQELPLSTPRAQERAFQHRLRQEFETRITVDLLPEDTPVPAP
jgi:hypothetical protein